MELGLPPRHHMASFWTLWHLTALCGPVLCAVLGPACGREALPHGEPSICSCRNRGPGEVKCGTDSSGSLECRAWS